MEEKDRSQETDKGLSPDQRQDRMKYRLADSVKECMRTTPVDKITVKNIVEECGTTRQTFYRHFLDKYDLINWYFDKLVQVSFDRMGQGTTVYDGLVKKFHFIRQERVFFCGAFRSDDRNSLKEHDFDLILQFYLDKIMEKTHQVPDEEIRFLLEMYCSGSVYMTVKWVLTGMKFTPEELAGFLVEAMPRKLGEEFVRLGLLEEPRAHREDGEAAAQSSGKIREW